MTNNTINNVFRGNGATEAQTTVFFDGLSHQSIFFAQERYDLSIKVLGEQDKLIIKNWFVTNHDSPDNNPHSFLEGFYADGFFLKREDVQSLVNVMRNLDVGDGTSAYDMNTLDEIPSNVIGVIDQYWNIL